MTPIRTIMLCALLVLSMTAAVAALDKMSKTPTYGTIPTPLQCHHVVPTLHVPTSSTDTTCLPSKSLSFYRFRLIAFILSLSFIRSFVVRYSDLATALTAEVWKYILKPARSCDPRKTSHISTTRRPKGPTDSAVEETLWSRHLQLAEADHAFESGRVGELGVDQMAYR